MAVTSLPQRPIIATLALVFATTFRFSILAHASHFLSITPTSPLSPSNSQFLAFATPRRVSLSHSGTPLIKQPISEAFPSCRDCRYSSVLRAKNSGKKHKKREEEEKEESKNNESKEDDIAFTFVQSDQDELSKKIFSVGTDWDHRALFSLEKSSEPTNKDRPSLQDFEVWNKKNELLKKQQSKQQFWKRLFPWWSPLSSFLFPKQYTSSGAVSQSVFSLLLRNPRVFAKQFGSRPNSARDLLVTLNTVAFLYQIVTAVWYLPGFNRVLAASVAGDAVSAAALAGANIPQLTRMDAVLRALGFSGGGSSIVISSGSRSVGASVGRAAGRRVMGGRGPIAAHSMGPFFLDYAHQPFPLSYYQRHRYLTSGFLHGSLLHLYMNVRALLSIPSWLENGLGKRVYLSAYLVAIITGNMAHTFASIGNRSAQSLCIGASGGICGLYGLMFASLLKMGSVDSAYYVFKQMVWLLAVGFLIPNVSNAGHLGGFIGGWLVGYLFGPGYRRQYSLYKGKGLMAVDELDRDFRRVLGPGVYPDTKQAIFPLRYLFMGAGFAILAMPDLRLIPLSIFKGILEPGTLSGVRALLR